MSLERLTPGPSLSRASRGQIPLTIHRKFSFVYITVLFYASQFLLHTCSTNHGFGVMVCTTQLLDLVGTGAIGRCPSIYVDHAVFRCLLFSPEAIHMLIIATASITILQLRKRYGNRTMAQEFPTTKKSLTQLCAYVLDRFPESQTELYLTQRDKNVLSEHGSTATMLDRLQENCIQFPSGLLRVQTDHPYGIVIMLWCHCTLENFRANCECESVRPNALLRISELAVGNKHSPHRQAEISTQAREAMALPPVRSRNST